MNKPAALADDALDRVAATIAARRDADPASSYVAALFAKGDDAILKKIGEEATETVMAGKGMAAMILTGANSAASIARLRRRSLHPARPR